VGETQRVIGMGLPRLVTVLRGAGQPWIEKNALLYDTFTTDDAAPITSPRTCEPGPGLLAVTDTENKLSLSGGNLVCAGGKTSPAYDDPSAWLGRDNAGSVATQAITAGDAAFLDFTPAATNTICRFAFDATSGGAMDSSIVYYRNNGNIELLKTGSDPVLCAYTATQQRVLIVPRSDTTGFFTIIGGTLYWADEETITSSVFVRLNNYNMAFTAADLALLPLADYNSAWGGDWSEVTDTKTNPASGTTFICESDFHLNETLTVEDTKYVYLYCRRTDNNNAVRVGIASDRSVELRNYIDGTPEVLYAGAALTDGVSYEFDLVMEGSAYWLYQDKVLKASGNVANAANNLVTGGSVLTTLATNDIVITTHPYAALGIADSRVVCPQAADSGTMSSSAVVEFKNVQPGTGAYQWKLRDGGGGDYILLDLAADGGLDLWDWNGPSKLIDTSAGTVSSGDDIVAVIDGADVEVFVAGTSVGSSSSFPASTGTGWGINAVNGAACDHTSFFPRDVSGLLPKGSY
jgi:hypothetical protein